MSEPSDASLKQLQAQLGQALDAIDGDASNAADSAAGGARALRDIVREATRLDELLFALDREVQALLRHDDEHNDDEHNDDEHNDDEHNDEASRAAADALLAIAAEYRQALESAQGWLPKPTP